MSKFISYCAQKGTEQHISERSSGSEPTKRREQHISKRSCGMEPTKRREQHVSGDGRTSVTNERSTRIFIFLNIVVMGHFTRPPAPPHKRSIAFFLSSSLSLSLSLSLHLFSLFLCLCASFSLSLFRHSLDLTFVGNNADMLDTFSYRRH